MRYTIAKFATAILSVTLSVVALFGAYMLAFPPTESITIGQLGWYLFAFVTGVMAVTLPSSLAIAYVVEPFAKGRTPLRALTTLLPFALGLGTILVLYGTLAAFAGREGLSYFHNNTGHVRDWVYFIVGALSYALALGEIGLNHFRLAAYTGKVPYILRRRVNWFYSYFLGIFLGNIGVGTAAPGILFLLLESASRADVYYGGSLFGVHALGRIATLLVLIFISSFGFPRLHVLVERKERLRRTSGWLMILVSGVVLIVGLASGVSSLGGDNGAYGLLGLPFAYNILLSALFVYPLIAHYVGEKRRVGGALSQQLKKLTHTLHHALSEREEIKAIIHFPVGHQHTRTQKLDQQIEGLLKERFLLEDALRHGDLGRVRDAHKEHEEEMLLRMRRNFYIALIILIFALFFVFPPIVAFR
jgi:cytochrome c-type biogenesis protein